MPTAIASTPLDGLAILKTLPLKIANFCREYIIDFNGKQAAIRAGYSRNGASSKASQLLANINVSQAVHALTQRKADRLALTAERVMTEVACISFLDPRELFDDNGKLKKPKEWSQSCAAAVSSYNWKKGEVTFHPKNPALTLAARITKIVDSDAVPVHMQGNFMVMCPADASPEQWKLLASAQAAVMAKAPQAIASTNGHPRAHASNGDQE